MDQTSERGQGQRAAGPGNDLVVEGRPPGLAAAEPQSCQRRQRQPQGARQRAAPLILELDAK